ncbi:alpha/beta fold hydrolase [Actinoplanes sp. N902-109]|uniref:alpha/beta fold hydrolase n=1 Tax=Actinoplanes sp. (strain N902-109) TaxID=649831 RepID=UPI00032962CA|nr:alpha/beta hydrolase [Actinoplanes sp. N902-109]AGL16216.1 hydrolase [Actinoplanes sp. N902-109]
MAHPGGPGLSWEYLRMPLVEREMTMVYLEPAGTGSSSPLGEGTYADHLDVVVRAFAREPAFVLGHDHGGEVAQSFVRDHPGRVAGLILYATSPVAGPRAAAGLDEEAATRRMRETFPGFFADYRRREAEFVHLRHALRCWPASAAAFDVRASLSAITAPTLVISGAHDRMVTPDAAAALHRGIPGSQQVVFSESAHLAHLEEAERFAHLVIEFIRRHSGAARTAPGGM